MLDVLSSSCCNVCKEKALKRLGGRGIRPHSAAIRLLETMKTDSALNLQHCNFRLAPYPIYNINPSAELLRSTNSGRGGQREREEGFLPASYPHQNSVSPRCMRRRSRSVPPSYLVCVSGRVCVGRHARLRELTT